MVADVAEVEARSVAGTSSFATGPTKDTFGRSAASAAEALRFGAVADEDEPDVLVRQEARRVDQRFERVRHAKCPDEPDGESMWLAAASTCAGA